MLIPAQKRNEVLRFLDSLSRKTREDPGCVSCRAYIGAEEEDGILLEELWNDELFLERHLRSADFNKVIQISELSDVPPEFRFDTILHSAGIEAIAKARNSSGAESAETTTPTQEVSP